MKMYLPPRGAPNSRRGFLKKGLFGGLLLALGGGGFLATRRGAQVLIPPGLQVLNAAEYAVMWAIVQRSRYLTVTHLVGKKEIFRARDFVERCEFDLTLEVIEGSIRLTDLDDDGEPEVSFVYRSACRSDVSPLTAKLLLYEGSTKYALRGTTRERVGETEYEGGAYTVDPSFEQGPGPFIEFAKAQWKSLIVEAAGAR